MEYAESRILNAAQGQMSVGDNPEVQYRKPAQLAQLFGLARMKKSPKGGTDGSPSGSEGQGQEQGYP